MQTYCLELLPEDCAAIVGALSNHPYRQVAPLIDKIRQQCAEQEAPKTSGLTESEINEMAAEAARLVESVIGG